MLYIASTPYMTLLLTSEFRNITAHSNFYIPKGFKRFVICFFFPICLFRFCKMVFIFLPSADISTPRYVIVSVFSVGFFPVKNSENCQFLSCFVSHTSTESFGTWHTSCFFPTSIALHLSTPNCKYLFAVFTFM